MVMSLLLEIQAKIMHVTSIEYSKIEHFGLDVGTFNVSNDMMLQPFRQASKENHVTIFPSFVTTLGQNQIANTLHFKWAGLLEFKDRDLIY